MNFWGKQQQTKRYILLLILLFSLATIFTIFVINLMVGIFVYPFLPTQSVIWHQFTGFIVASMLLVIIGGSIWEAYRLKNGGFALAKRLGARRIQFKTSVPEENILKNVVEEISIASGIAMPALYVMDDEVGVNAFMAGYRAQDMILVVTWGLLQTLDRHELQGVIGHEFSHIYHGDTQLNLRLVAWVGGLLVVSQIGSWIAQTGFSLQREVQRERRADALFVVLGGVIWLAGSLGVLVARFLKYAVIKQREFLADTASMQFTRNSGILQALLRIRAHHIGTQLHGVYTESISHFCFGQALHANTWVSTQPDLDTRIYALSPTALRRARVQERIIARQQSDRLRHVPDPEAHADKRHKDATLDWQPPYPLPKVRIQPQTTGIKDAVNPLNPEYRLAATRPDIIKRALSTPTGCRELLAAILALRQRSSHELDTHQVSRAITEALQTLDQRLHVSIFMQAVEAQGNLPASAGRQLLTRLSDIIQRDGYIGLLDILLLERVKSRLGLLPQVVPVALDQCTYTIVILIEALLHVQEITRVQQAKVRDKILKTILSPWQFNQVVNLIVTQQPVNLGLALYQLSGLLKRERMNILAAAETCLWSDTAITQEEQDVLELLYWRFGFEANTFADYTTRKLALEI